MVTLNPEMNIIFSVIGFPSRLRYRLRRVFTKDTVVYVVEYHFGGQWESAAQLNETKDIIGDGLRIVQTFENRFRSEGNRV